jgi:DNA-binding CsgD family transcriptional regulator
MSRPPLHELPSALIGPRSESDPSDGAPVPPSSVCAAGQCSSGEEAGVSGLVDVVGPPRSQWPRPTRGIPPEDEQRATADPVGSLFTSDGDKCRPPGVGHEVQAPAGRRANEYRRLTAQEATIIRMTLDGMGERQVAEELFISALALRAHMAHICAKLDIPSPAFLGDVVGRGTALGVDTARSEQYSRGSHHDARRDRLTEQEVAVLQLTHEGSTMREVAAQLGIGVVTVRSHLAHIQAKLDIGPFPEL